MSTETTCLSQICAHKHVKFINHTRLVDKIEIKIIENLNISLTFTILSLSLVRNINEK